MSVCPISEIELKFGCVFGSHSSICGSPSSGANTDSVGCPADNITDSSVGRVPNVIDGSRYICADTGVNPIAGPPERISNRTPVSASPAISGPDTLWCLASTE